MAIYEIELEDGSMYEIETEEPKPKTGIAKVSENITKFARQPIDWQQGLYNISERPAAAIRSAIQGTGYTQGAVNPQQVPTFEQLTKQQYPIRTDNIPTTIADIATRLPMQMGGQGLDIATNPLNSLMALLPFAPGMKQAGQAIQGGMGQAGQLVGNVGKKVMQSAAGQMPQKALANTMKSLETIKNIPNKFFRGGLTKQDALRVEAQYGGSNGTLVDVVKQKLGEKITKAEQAYQSVMSNAPEGKQINIRPAIEQAGNRLKRLGLITDKGNLTELGQSEIMQDSVYGKLLDFYKSSNAISGVEKLQGKDLTQGQMVKSFKALRETLVNKDQYTFLRDKLNALYKNKPSDVDVGRVVNQFYADGEASGIKGLQEARGLMREAFKKEELFLNSKTGDLKIATEAKLNKLDKLSLQEKQHILELQQYIQHPITSDATKINMLNKAKDLIKRAKQWGKGVAAGAVAGEVGRKTVTGHW